MNCLLKGGLVFNGDELQSLDVLVENGKIAQLGKGIASENARVYSIDEMLVSPGFTDLHTHLRQPGHEEKESMATGTAAAAAGGFTTVCAMPNLVPVPCSLKNLQVQLDIIKESAKIRVLPYGALTQGQNGETPASMEEMAVFVAGFSDDGRGVQNKDVMRKAMKLAARCGRMVAAHCEDESQIKEGAVCIQQNSGAAHHWGYQGVNNESEWKMVQRDIALAQKTGCRLHICHASTKESFALVRAAKAHGLPVSCEVTPHNLLLSYEDINEDNARFKMNPPLRSRQDVQAAVQALRDKTIDAIATDHAPHTKKEKSKGFAGSLNGVVGLETAFAALYTGLVYKGLISVEELLQLLTWRPRGVIKEARQRIAPGEVADLTVLDLKTERLCKPESFVSKGRASPFAQRRLRGWPVLTIYKSEVVYAYKSMQ